MAQSESFILTAAGDAIVNRRLTPYESEDQFRKIIDQIRDADLSVVNLETLLHDDAGYPSPNAPGTYMRSPPWVADELEWAGFDVFAAATNHTFDFVHGGMEATMRELEARELPYAGLGRTLARARAPKYVDTPAGRAALVAACSTVTPGSEAGNPRSDYGGRPGVSPLGLETSYRLPEPSFDRLQEMVEELGLEDLKRRRAKLGFPITGQNDDTLRLLNLSGGAHPAFNRGEKFAIERRVDENDANAIVDRVRDARRQAEWVVVSLHAHEGTDGAINDHTVPRFMEGFARRCIDAGADAFVGHGPHVLRGIELYEGAPIFYSLGNFAMQNETVEFVPKEMYDRYGLGNDHVPADVFDARVYDENGDRTGFLSDSAFWESVLPVCRFEGNSLVELELCPLDLQFEASRSRRGRPIAATGATAAEILESLADLSEPYGTQIDVDGERGTVIL